MKKIWLSVIGILVLTATPALAGPCKGRYCNIKEIQYIVEFPTNSWKTCGLNYDQQVQTVETILKAGGVPFKALLSNADKATEKSQKHKFTLYLNGTVIDGVSCSANLSLEFYVQGVASTIDGNPYVGNFMLWRQNIVVHGPSDIFAKQYESGLVTLLKLFVDDWQKEKNPGKE